MNDPLGMHMHVRFLEAGYSLPASSTMRKKRECVAGELIQDGVVVTT
ncbi:MAG: hypothetical protein M3Z05_13655 [Gemmatimonadota bacterium]|nr:hypothetical protein [Gemmatimonadota bacterium]